LDKKVEKSLRFSIYDGIFASGMVGFASEFFSPFLISIGATARQIGILSAVPNLIASLLQIKSAEMTDLIGSRKKTLNIFVLMQAIMLAVIALFILQDRVNVNFFIFMVTLFVSFGAFATPAWGSLMSDLVPEDIRGRYFGTRNMIIGFVTVITMLLGGVIIHSFENAQITVGFSLVFMLAFSCRIISLFYIRKMYEPVPAWKPGKGFTFFTFLANIKSNNFTRFVVAVSLMNFSVNIAAPFFAVLMLRELQFSYLLYTGIVTTGNAVVFLTMRRWGIHADRVGNIKIIKATSLFISIIPLFWIIDRNPVYLMFIQMAAGFLWAGFNLSASNFVYDSVPSHERTKSIAYFNVINGCAIFAGAITGGILVKNLPAVFGSKILTLFLLSTVIRVFITFFLILKLQEVRSVMKIKSIDLFSSMIGIRPVLGVERKTLRY
jgi:MFS family permease